MIQRSLCLAVLIAAIAAAAPAAARTCDRACLSTGLDTYLTALTRHAPRKAKLARTYRATENGKLIAAGEGLWSSATALGGVQRRYLDAVTGQAAFYGLIREGDTPAIVLLRLRFRNGKVAESEAVISRKGDRLYDPEGFARNAPAPDADKRPAAATTKRAALVALADSYLDAMQNHSGANVPHTPDCVRLEAGIGGVTATGERHGCTDGFERLVQISAVGHRRLSLVDEPAGVVVGTMMFLRPPGATMPNGQPWKRNLLMNVFTAQDGAVSGVYSATHYLEPGEPETTGWPDR